jgi:hypothetical protein
MGAVLSNWLTQYTFYGFLEPTDENLKMILGEEECECSHPQVVENPEEEDDFHEADLADYRQEFLGMGPPVGYRDPREVYYDCYYDDHYFYQANSSHWEWGDSLVGEEG